METESYPSTKSGSSQPVETHVAWHLVTTLIDRSEYQQAADILYKLQLAIAENDDVLMTKILAAICQRVCFISVIIRSPEAKCGNYSVDH